MTLASRISTLGVGSEFMQPSFPLLDKVGSLDPRSPAPPPPVPAHLYCRPVLGQRLKVKNASIPLPAVSDVG